MITLSAFFEINHDIILFAYGLIFFVLGLAIIIRIRQSTHSDLARSLRWLAFFGIMHGFNEWGDLFIPLQAQYLSFRVLRGLYILQLILLTVSFACLFEFGVTTLRSIGRANYLRGVSGVLTAIWFVGILFLFTSPTTSHHEARHLAITFSRYFIGFPGGLLAAYGLRIFTAERIVPLDMPKIVNTFKVAGYSIAIYAVLSGLIPPPVNFFPGNVLNSKSFMLVTGIPPWIFRSIIAFIITVTIIRGLEIFEIETQSRIEELEQKQIIATERERYARELHDGAIQKVYTAGLLVESASRIAEPNSEMSKRLEQSVSVLNDTIADLRQNLVELHAHKPTEPTSIPTLLEQLANTPHYRAMINISIITDLPISKQLSPRRTNHITAIVNEALANTVRHAQAQEVQITAKDLGEHLRITIKDDGIGLPDGFKAGYGLSNMRDRTKLLNGSIKCIKDNGTSIILTAPWTDTAL